MPDESLSAADKTVVAFCEIIAFALGWAGVDRLLAGSQVKLYAPIFVVSAGISYFGFKWPSLKNRMSGGMTSTVERLALSYRVRIGMILGVALIGGTYVLIFMHSLRSDLDEYVMSRRLTEKQSHDLGAFLSDHQAFPVTVKVAVHDAEAEQYANDIYNVFYAYWKKDAHFQVSESPSDGPMNTLNDGLGIGVLGQGAGPADRNQEQTLQEAFRTANIDVSGGGSVTDGEYKVFILVGHRPLAIHEHHPTLSKVGQWIEKFGEQ